MQIMNARCLNKSKCLFKSPKLLLFHRNNVRGNSTLPEGGDWMNAVDRIRAKTFELKDPYGREILMKSTNMNGLVVFTDASLLLKDIFLKRKDPTREPEEVHPGAAAAVLTDRKWNNPNHVMKLARGYHGLSVDIVEVEGVGLALELIEKWMEQHTKRKLDQIYIVTDSQQACAGFRYDVDSLELEEPLKERIRSVKEKYTEIAKQVPLEILWCKRNQFKESVLADRMARIEATNEKRRLLRTSQYINSEQQIGEKLNYLHKQVFVPDSNVVLQNRFNQTVIKVDGGKSLALVGVKPMFGKQRGCSPQGFKGLMYRSVMIEMFSLIGGDDEKGKER